MRRSLQDHLDPSVGPKRILSLSGGGVRGLVTLGALNTLEQLLIAQYGTEDVRLCDHFDLIAGTSTGSIIATALALGWRVSEVQALYDKLCPVLFKPTFRKGFLRPKFNAAPLTRMLEEKLSDERGDPIRLGSDKLLTGLLICAKRMDTDAAWLLTNNPKAKFYNTPVGKTWLPNRLYPLASIVRASAAAPSFLEPVKITISPGDGAYDAEEGVFVDGAIGGHNCPAFAAFQVVGLKAFGFGWSAGEDNLSILSIGTGQYRVRHETQNFMGLRTVNQSVSALMGLINESQRNTLMTMQALSKPQKPWYINSEVGGLSDELLTDKPLFGFRHMDIALDDDTDMKKRLQMEAPKLDRKFTKAAKGLQDMANGRTKNLSYARQLGASLGAETTIDELFV